MAGSTMGGPRPRGERKALSIRPPADHMDLYEAERRRLGYRNRNEYIVAVLAKMHGLDVPDWARPRGGANDEDAFVLPLGA